MNTLNQNQAQTQDVNAFKKKAKEASQKFESFFMYQLLETMDVGTPEETGGGFAEDMFRGMRNEFLADNLTKSQSSIGLADTIYKEILASQEIR